MPSRSAVLLAAAALAVRGADAQEVCSIGAVFSGLGEVKANGDCQAGCNSGSGDCPPDWTPGRADNCNAACGAVFEP